MPQTCQDTTRNKTTNKNIDTRYKRRPPAHQKPKQTIEDYTNQTSNQHYQRSQRRTAANSNSKKQKRPNPLKGPL